jgi:Flp pilus assembly protein TadB
MKFISLFTKTPNHKRFNYTPRYWDQAAEERKEREERIRRELEREQGLNPSGDPDYRSRIAGSFHSARRRSNKSSGELNSVLLRSGVLLFLVLFLMAFLTWGTDSLYALLIFIPVYFYFKFKK